MDVWNGPAFRAEPLSLGSFSDLLEAFSRYLGQSVFGGLAPLFLLLLLYLFLKKQWAAALIMWLIIATVEILFFGSSWTSTPFNLAIATLWVIAVFRFGLLTTMLWQLVFFLSAFYPLTADLSIWYANRSIFTLTVLVALASYGAYVSMGSHRMFQGRLLED